MKTVGVFLFCENFALTGRRGRCPAPNDNSKTINQLVILSEGRRVRSPTEVELSPSEERGESARHFADAGYGLKFRWLANGMLHQFKSHPNSEPYPCGAWAPWFCLFASLNPQNFDYANRFAVFSAQNDKLICCFEMPLQLFVFFFVFPFFSFQHLFALPLIFFRHFFKKLFTFIIFYVIKYSTAYFYFKNILYF